MYLHVSVSKRNLYINVGAYSIHDLATGSMYGEIGLTLISYPTLSIGRHFICHLPGSGKHSLNSLHGPHLQQHGPIKLMSFAVTWISLNWRSWRQNWSSAPKGCCCALEVLPTRSIQLLHVYYTNNIHAITKGSNWFVLVKDLAMVLGAVYSRSWEVTDGKMD